MLNASTAGMATKRPTAVATSASEMPAITADGLDAPAARLAFEARSAKARMIPSTVPKRPMNGALFPSVPRTNSHCSYSSRRRSIVEATAFSTASCPPTDALSATRTTSASLASPPAPFGPHRVPAGDPRGLRQFASLAEPEELGKPPRHPPAGEVEPPIQHHHHAHHRKADEEPEHPRGADAQGESEKASDDHESSCEHIADLA